VDGQCHSDEETQGIELNIQRLPQQGRVIRHSGKVTIQVIGYICQDVGDGREPSQTSGWPQDQEETGQARQEPAPQEGETRPRPEITEESDLIWPVISLESVPDKDALVKPHYQGQAPPKRSRTRSPRKPGDDCGGQDPDDAQGYQGAPATT
jgi:hypothetical protein